MQNILCLRHPPHPVGQPAFAQHGPQIADDDPLRLGVLQQGPPPVTAEGDEVSMPLAIVDTPTSLTLGERLSRWKIEVSNSSLVR